MTLIIDEVKDINVELNSNVESTLKISEALEKDDLDGIEITMYAAKYGLTVQAVWSKIRTGELVARTESGTVFVYNKVVPIVNTQSVDLAISSDQESQLPPLPQKLEVPKISYVSSRMEDAPVPSTAYLAVLLENLKSSKEEQREIIRLTQESIKQITTMTDKVLEMKDTLIYEKDSVLRKKESEIDKLNDLLAEQQHINKRLKQEKEDLEILVKAMDS